MQHKLLSIAALLLAFAGCDCSYQIRFWRLDRARGCLELDERLTQCGRGGAPPPVTGCAVDSKGELYQTNVPASLPGGRECTAEEANLVHGPNCS